MGRGPSYSGDILEYITKRPGELLYINDICKEFDVTKDQVQSAISRFKVRKNLTIETLVAGNTYRYLPDSKSNSGKKMFEEVGVTKKGLFILQDEEGNLYKAEELE